MILSYTVASAVSAIEAVLTDVVDSVDAGTVPQLTLVADARCVVLFDVQFAHLIHLIQVSVFHSLYLRIHTAWLPLVAVAAIFGAAALASGQGK